MLLAAGAGWFTLTIWSAAAAASDRGQARSGTSSDAAGPAGCREPVACQRLDVHSRSAITLPAGGPDQGGRCRMRPAATGRRGRGRWSWRRDHPCTQPPPEPFQRRFRAACLDLSFDAAVARHHKSPAARPTHAFPGAPFAGRHHPVARRPIRSPPRLAILQLRRTDRALRGTLCL